MNATLVTSSHDLAAGDLQDFTRDLCGAINRETAVKASLVEQKPGSGAKGDGFSLGTILLTLAGSGGVAVSLVNVLRVYVQRDRRLRIKIEAKDGDSMEIDSTNLEPDQIDRTIRLLSRILGTPK